jgi:hypothetical protein
LKHYILNLWFLNINRSMYEWICPKRQKKRRLVYVMTTYLRQHELMNFISLNIPEREINLHFVNLQDWFFNQSLFCILLKKFHFFMVLSYYIQSFDYTDCISKMEQNAPFCVLNFFFGWGDNPPRPPLPLLVSRGLVCM